MSGYTTRTSERDGVLRLSCADTAKLVRQALKRAFPGTKFRVRSNNYSMGASIYVDWEDGPCWAEVSAVAGRYAGADFDGMVDLKTYNRHWLMPDGTVALAHAGGQGSTNPEVFGDAPGSDAKLVRFGADYVLCQRSESDDVLAKATAIFEEIYGEPWVGDKRYGVRCDERFPALSVTGEESGWTLRWRIAKELS